MHVADATELGVNIRTTHAQDRRRGRAGKQPTLLDTAVNCMQCGKVRGELVDAAPAGHPSTPFHQVWGGP